jgi:multicomponent Na+:H+ antiporter subunit D
MIRPVLLIAFPLLFAFLSPLVGMWSKKGVKYLIMFATALNATLAGILLLQVLNHPIFDIIGGFQPPLGIVLMVGPIGALIAFIINIVAFVISIYNLKVEKEPIVKYSMLYLLLVMGSTGMVLTGDLFNLFVFLEVTSIASYGLAAYNKDKKGYIGAIKYVIIGSIGSTFVLLGIGLIYSQLRTLNMLDIAMRMGSMDPYVKIMAFTSLFLGFGVEAEMFPLNTWVPDAYDGAPHPISAAFASLPAKAGVFALARVIFTMFSFSNFLWFVVIMGLLTVFFGEIIAYTQKDVKRMLAYSSIGQMGMIIMGLGIGTTLAVEGAFYQMIAHALGKALLFIAAGFLIYAAKSSKISDMKGMARNPLIGIPILIGILSIMGMPPFAGFYGKFFILMGGFSQGYYAIIALFLAASIVEVAYYARFMKVLFQKGGPVIKPDAATYVPLIMLAIIIVVIGVYPKPILDVLQHVTTFIAGGA